MKKYFYSFAFLSIALAILPGMAHAAFPMAVSVSPTSAAPGQTVSILGNDLMRTMQVQFFRKGEANDGKSQPVALVTSPTVTQNSNGSSVVSFNMGTGFAGTANPGDYQLVVFTQDGLAGPLDFTVLSEPIRLPSISSINPSIAAQDSPVEIYGQNLSAATGIEFSDSADNSVVATFYGQNFTYTETGSGYGKLVFKIPASFMGMVGAGKYHIVVIAPAGRSNQSDLTVSGNVAQYPTIDSYTNGSVQVNGTVEVWGQNLGGTSAAKFYKGNTLVATVGNITVGTVALGSQNKLSFVIPPSFIGMVGAGTFQVKMLTPNGESPAFPLTVAESPIPAPTITQVAPQIAYQDTNVRVDGQNLKHATDVELYRNGSFSASTRLEPVRVLDYSISFRMGLMGANIAPGTYSLRVKSIEGVSNFLPFTFGVTSPTSVPVVVTQNPGSVNTSSTLSSEAAHIAMLQALINSLMAQLAAQRAAGNTTSVTSPGSTVTTSAPASVSTSGQISAPVLITSTPAVSESVTTSCSAKNLPVGVGYGTTDKRTNNAVTNIQNFLSKRGHLKVAPTGYFGNVTVAALKSFQKSVKLGQSGNIDNATRLAILATGTCK